MRAALPAILFSAAGCGDAVWDPADLEPPPAVAETPSPAETLSPPLSDVAVELPDPATVAAGIDGLGCVVHYRNSAGAYVSGEFGLRFGRVARRGARRAWALTFNVQGVVSRPREDGTMEALPPVLGVRAVCIIPGTERARDETLDRLEAILGERGSRPRAEPSALAPLERAVRYAWAGLRGVLDRAVPGPLSAQEDGSGECLERNEERECTLWSLPPLHVISIGVINIGCPAGFDFEYSSWQCIRTGFDPVPPIEVGPITIGSSGGGGNNGNNGEGEAGPRTVDFTLTCPSEVQRGATGSCRVTAPDSAGVNMQRLHFAWNSSLGAAEGPTKGMSAWSGSATGDATITVKVTDSTAVIAAFEESKEVKVKARTAAQTAVLKKQQSAADAIVTHSLPGRWKSGRWGTHAFEAVSLPEALEGSGPWKSHFMAGTSEPELQNGIFIHSDLTEDGIPVSTATISKASCRSAVDTLANTYTVNQKCGTLAHLTDWKTRVVDHELQHQSNLINCLGSNDVQTNLTTIEAITGATAAKVNGKIKLEWDRAEQRLAEAAEGRLQTPASLPLWEHRSSSLGNPTWKFWALQPVKENGRTTC